jgi:GT2 family glycosyltransferase
MRVLVQVHTWNDADVVGLTLEAIMQQTLGVAEIVVVDNASTDGTAELPYPDNVTVIRHPLNLGTSGSVQTGLGYARAHGYRWLWVLDADSVPRANALELLVGLAEDGVTEQQNVGVVCASHNLVRLGQMLRGRLLTPGGPRIPRLPRRGSVVDCDSVIWSGALINTAVVDRVGLPRAGTRGCWEDLSLDYGDTEYTYRIHHAGYRILVHGDSIIDHPVGKGFRRRILGWNLYSTNHPAFRRYLYFRNLVFFWLRIYHRRSWPMLLLWFGCRLTLILAGIVLLERDRRHKIKACFLGIGHGVCGRLDRSFGAPH